MVTPPQGTERELALWLSKKARAPGTAPLSAPLKQSSLSENEQVHFIYLLKKGVRSLPELWLYANGPPGKGKAGARAIYSLRQALHTGKVRL